MRSCIAATGTSICIGLWRCVSPMGVDVRLPPRRAHGAPLCMSELTPVLWGRPARSLMERERLSPLTSAVLSPTLTNFHWRQHEEDLCTCRDPRRTGGGRWHLLG